MFNKTLRFGSLLCFRLQIKKIPNLVDPLNNILVAHQCRCFLYLKKESETASETSALFKKLNDGKSKKKKKDYVKNQECKILHSLLTFQAKG